MNILQDRGECTAPNIFEANKKWNYYEWNFMRHISLFFYVYHNHTRLPSKLMWYFICFWMFSKKKKEKMSDIFADEIFFCCAGDCSGKYPCTWTTSPLSLSIPWTVYFSLCTIFYRSKKEKFQSGIEFWLWMSENLQN